MFAKEGVYPAAGLFSWGHLILIIIFGSLNLLLYTRLKKWEKHKFLSFNKYFSIFILLLEIIKILWNLWNYPLDTQTLNRIIPLYYCSIFIYSYLIVSFGNKKWRQISGTWIIYGGIISGICFVIYPSSSLLIYPPFHFLSIHSLFFHFSMIVVGLLLVKHQVYIPRFSDFKFFVFFSLFFLIAAVTVNKLTGTNMMFLSAPFGLLPLQIIYNFSPIVYEIFVFFGQLTLPFLLTNLAILPITIFQKAKNYTLQEDH